LEVVAEVWQAGMAVAAAGQAEGTSGSPSLQVSNPLPGAGDASSEGVDWESFTFEVEQEECTMQGATSDGDNGTLGTGLVGLNPCSLFVKDGQHLGLLEVLRTKE
jgi:hypothetical protein